MTPEEKIKEQRTIEATQKDYMGKGGKLGCIMKYLGEPIRSHYSGMLSETLYEDPWELNDENEIPVFDEDEFTATIGHFFDGTNRGMHLEIKYMDEALSVHYLGHPVYLEVSGNLERYFPSPEWEDKIEKLYELATRLKRQDLKERKKEKKQAKERAHNKWLDNIWRKWGFKV
jgi:hypothetical protein